MQLRHLPSAGAVVAALLLAGASAGAVARSVHGYGLSLTLPSGWVGHVQPVEISASAPEGAVVQLDEAVVSPQRHVRVPRHVRAGTTRLFVESAGRKFFLYVHTTRARLAQTDRVLVSLRVRPWRARLAAPRFKRSPGWQVGHSGPKPVGSDAFVSAWASTVPYRNSPVDLPPEATLAQAGAEGVVVYVSLVRPPPGTPLSCSEGSARSQEALRLA